MNKLFRFSWVWMMLAAVSGCGAGETAGAGRGSTSGAPRGGSSGPSFGASGSSSLPGGPRSGAAAGLAPVVPNNGQKPSALDEDTCASASVDASRITPTVYLVIDGSGSMNARFGGGTRWSVLREAMVGANGVVTKLESVVNFGMSIYSNNDPMMCPSVVNVDPSKNNFMPISMAYPALETGGGTPTGEALQKVVDSLPDFTAIGPDSKADAPPIIVLATDGEPNGCAAGVICNWVDWANCLTELLNGLANAAPTYDTTLAAVRAAKAKGIAVWVVSLADGLNNIPDLQRTANIGAGLEENANPPAMIYSPQNPDELTGTLTKLIGDVVSCEVVLEGSLAVDRACEGTVTLNSDVVPCGDDNGWRALDDKRIEILGTACQRFKSDPTVVLDARFPCDVVRPQ
jgi:Mg-chelatase subunit ChlD